jgi:putative ABC transport system permease protein
MLQLRPILSTLSRHRTAALLIVLEIALTCAIVCNAVFLIVNRFDRLQFASGLADNELVYLSISSIGRDPEGPANTLIDLAALRAIPGVRSAAIVNEIPYGKESNNTGLSVAAGQKTPTMDVSLYKADVGGIGTLGLHLLAGRDFKPDEVMDGRAFDQSSDPRIPSAIIARDVADEVFPGRDAVGQVIYLFNDHPTRVVGVVDRLIRPQPGNADRKDLRSIILPVRQTFNAGMYMLRTDPQQRDAVLQAAQKALDRKDGRRVAGEQGRFEDLRRDFYRSDVSMVWLLAGVCVALLVVTAFGIVGLASFWVQQRTKMIGTRRALGATRGQILRYFQTENLLLTSAGIALGMLGAFAINQWLMTQYELPRLPALYLPLGALALWALGQIAVLAPARRAAALPPAHAMRGLA